MANCYVLTVATTTLLHFNSYCSCTGTFLCGASSTSSVSLRETVCLWGECQYVAAALRCDSEWFLFFALAPENVLSSVLKVSEHRLLSLDPVFSCENPDTKLCWYVTLHISKCVYGKSWSYLKAVLQIPAYHVDCTPVLKHRFRTTFPYACWEFFAWIILFTVI